MNVYYTKALDTLIVLQQCTTNNPTLPVFDSHFIQQEIQLFQTWFLEAWLGLHLTGAEKSCIEHTLQQLCLHLMSQPQVFIHRDYHSRNLLILNKETNPTIGVIDFQDAMQGPWAYDLVSLIKDCYLNWSEEQQAQWVHYFYQQLSNPLGWSLGDFQHALDWCGLQRHLKVLGNFCRLHLRDKKSAYLHNLPLTLNHTMRALARYPTFHALYEFMQERVLNPFKDKQPA
jgi:aminoglycoside/choline kinase family phosphotransferase